MKMMYFRTSDRQFYSFPIDNSTIPVSYLEFNTITNKLKQGHILKVDSSGKPYVIKPTLVKNIESWYKEHIMAMNIEYENICGMIRGTYPETETTTWPVQLSESLAYREWVANGSVLENRPDFVLLDSLSRERDKENVGDGISDLVDRVIRNAQMYNLVLSRAIARRHSMEKTVTRYLHESDLEAMSTFKVDYNSVYLYLRSLGL